MAKRTTKSNAGREGVTASARATGQTSDQQPKRRGRPAKARSGFEPATTPEQDKADALAARHAQEARAPSAGPTPEELPALGPSEPAQSPKEAKQEAIEDRKAAEQGHPSAGPTPDELDPAQSKPAESPKEAKEAAVEDRRLAEQGHPSAGPTPEDLESQAAHLEASLKDRAERLANDRRSRAEKPGGVDQVGNLKELKA